MKQLLALVTLTALVLLCLGGPIMAEGNPDFTQAVRLLGVNPSGDLVTVVLDANGQLVTLIKGTDGTNLQTVKTDAAGRIVTVLRDPSSDRYLAIDASGNIVAVMKGMYAGAAKTLATDVDGRLIAVLNDQVNLFGDDYTFGLGELAVRLGSPSVFERRGSVMWWDSFEHGLLHWELPSGGTAAAVVSSIDSKSGGFSALVTSYNDQLNEAVIAHRETLLDLTGRVGVEFSFQHQDLWTGNIYLWALLDTGADTFMFGVRWNRDTSVLQVYDNGVWTTVDLECFIVCNIKSWSTLKLVVDCATHDYVRLYANGYFYDLSTYTSEAQGFYSSPGVEVRIGPTAIDAVAESWLIDDVIVTTNEPAV
jgi:hypothetical protein